MLDHEKVLRTIRSRDECWDCTPSLWADGLERIVNDVVLDPHVVGAVDVDDVFPRTG